MREQSKHLKWFGIPTVGRFIMPHIRLIVILALCMGASSGIDAAFPLFQNYAITHFIGEKTLDTLVPYIILYIAVLLVQSFFNVWGCYCSCKAEVCIDEDVRMTCFNHVQTLSFSYFNRNSVGYIHSRLISDPDRIGLLVSWGLMDAIINVTYLVGIFIVMFCLNAYLGFLLLLVVPFEFAVTWFFRRKITDENRKVREINSRITGNYNEGITGAETIRSLVIEQRMCREFEEDSAAMKVASIRAGRYKQLFQSGIVFLSGIALTLILWQGGVLTEKGVLLIGSLSVFMNYAISIGTYVQELVDTISNLIDTQVVIERVDDLLHTGSDVNDTPEVIARYGDTFHPKKENWEALNGDIEFRDVTFQYPDGDEPVLEHFNLKVPQGTMIAIVGETGAGKSTIANLVCRFYEPTEGRVLVDGRDARERSQLWLHSHIGYVLQTPHLFSGTVLENLKYGNPDATPEQIEAACKKVCADKVIARLEKGYDSEVGEGGSLLSTGEKQLISFARALIADPRILILDEATSSVDTLTEAMIKEAISELTAGRTSFCIAHRLSTIRGADLILVMKDGRIVEQGTHESLMAAKGYYYRLCLTSTC